MRTIHRRIFGVLAGLVVVGALLILYWSLEATDPGRSVSPSTVLEEASHDVVAPATKPPVNREASHDEQSRIQIVDAITGEVVVGSWARARVLGQGARGKVGLKKASPGLFVFEEASPGDELRISAGCVGYQVVARRVVQSEDALLVTFELVPLSGVVVHVIEESEGLPAPAVKVSLKIPGWASQTSVSAAQEGESRRLPAIISTETDGTGRAFFDGIPVGRGFSITCLGGPLTAPAVVDGIEVPLGGIAEVDALLRAGARIVGRVSDCHGGPGEGFRVTCRNVEAKPGGEGYSFEQTVDTRPDGRFEFERLTTGEKLLRGIRRRENRFEAFSLTASLEAGQVLDLGVVPSPVDSGSSLTGRVLDEHGTAASGARVRLRAPADTYPGQVKIDFVTDGDGGGFQVCGLPSGQVFVSAAKTIEGKLWSDFVRFSLEREEEREVTLQLKHPGQQPPGGHINLKLFLPDDRPADLTEYDFVAYLRIDSESWIVELDAGGLHDDADRNTLRLGHPPPGVYGILVIGQEHIGVLEEVNVSEGAVTDASLRLSEPAPLRGQVVDSVTGKGVSATVARALVSGEIESFKQHTEPVETAADGTFEVVLLDTHETGAIVVSAHGYETKRVAVNGMYPDLGLVRIEPEAR